MAENKNKNEFESSYRPKNNAVTKVIKLEGNAILDLYSVIVGILANSKGVMTVKEIYDKLSFGKEKISQKDVEDVLKGNDKTKNVQAYFTSCGEKGFQISYKYTVGKKED